MGGELVFNGSYSDLLMQKDSLTAQYLSGQLAIEVPKRRRRWNDYLWLRGAAENNLKNLNVKFPLNVFTVITGVSGSGKSTLIKRVLYPAIKKRYGGMHEISGKFSVLEGDVNRIQNIEFVDQNPIGRSSRSNPATYVKAFDDIRSFVYSQHLSKVRGYKPG